MPDHTYARHYIKSVIFRLDFPIPILSLEANERPLVFQRAVLAEFPLVEEQSIIKQEVHLSPRGAESTQKESRLYLFHSAEHTCKIGLTSAFLFIEHNAYNGFADFSRLVDLAVENLYRNWPETSVNRLGLRYLNQITIPELNEIRGWTDYIDDRLLSALELFSTERLSRYIVQTEFKGEDYSARIMTGMPNPDYPGLIQQYQFNIDLDIYIQEAVERQDIHQKVDHFHAEIIKYFENSIKQPLRDLMDA